VNILPFPDNDENEPPYDKILLLNSDKLEYSDHFDG